MTTPSTILESAVKDSATIHDSGRKKRPFFSPIVLRPKLIVGSADDACEKEAETMAARVVSMPDQNKASPFFAPKRALAVQRICNSCPEEERLRKKGNGKSPSEAPPVVSEVLHSDSGKSLDLDTRSFMETRFGHDFSQVRIHDSPRAAMSAGAVQAQAYTAGNHIVFNSGRYDPATRAGKELLAHELTHIIQQTGRGAATIRRLGANPSCTPAQTRQIHQAIFDARGWINNALAKIEMVPRHPRVIPSLRRNFGPVHGAEANLPLITGRIRVAYRTLGTMPVTCDTPGTTHFCATNHCGWANFGSNAATICTNPPSTLDIAPPFAIHCILHESFHAGMSFMTVDNYVGTAGYPGAGTDPLLNADSYTQFIQELS